MPLRKILEDGPFGDGSLFSRILRSILAPGEGGAPSLTPR